MVDFWNRTFSERRNFYEVDENLLRGRIVDRYDALEPLDPSLLLLSIEEKVGPRWMPLLHEGRPFDDVWQPVHIRYRPLRLFRRGETWNARFALPAESAEKQLRVRVSAWGDFPGFVEPIPE